MGGKNKGGNKKSNGATLDRKNHRQRGGGGEGGGGGNDEHSIRMRNGEFDKGKGKGGGGEDEEGDDNNDDDNDNDKEGDNDKDNNKEKNEEKNKDQDKNSDNEDSDEDSDEASAPGSGAAPVKCRIFLWEFNQNDSKRDSGSKMVRFGYAKKLRIGESFPGIVLSSEAKICASPADRDLVDQFGISGINCSWNKLDEIPFGSMGKGRNQRILPFLVAANTVNYGKPFKMNTVEATAACLYIAGYKEDARNILDPFSFGKEFISLNLEGLEAYSMCSSAEEVKRLSDGYISQVADNKKEKEARKAASQGNNAGVGGYMDDMGLPDYDDYDDYEEEEEEEKEKEEKEKKEKKKKKNKKKEEKRQRLQIQMYSRRKVSFKT